MSKNEREEKKEKIRDDPFSVQSKYLDYFKWLDEKYMNASKTTYALSVACEVAASEKNVQCGRGELFHALDLQRDRNDELKRTYEMAMFLHVNDYEQVLFEPQRIGTEWDSLVDVVNIKRVRELAVRCGPLRFDEVVRNAYELHEDCRKANAAHPSGTLDTYNVLYSACLRSYIAQEMRRAGLWDQEVACRQSVADVLKKVSGAKTTHTEIPNDNDIGEQNTELDEEDDHEECGCEK